MFAAAYLAVVVPAAMIFRAGNSHIEKATDESLELMRASERTGRENLELMKINLRIARIYACRNGLKQYCDEEARSEFNRSLQDMCQN